MIRLLQNVSDKVLTRVTNSPVFTTCPGQVMIMSWFSKNCWEGLALQQNIDGQTRRMRKKNRIKRKKTKYYFIYFW